MRVVETTLATAHEDAVRHGLQPPAIICIGHVVRMRAVLDWMSQMGGEAPRDLDPLEARRIAGAG